MIDDSFQGMVLKGVFYEYDWRFLKNYLQEGEIFVFLDIVFINKVLVFCIIVDKFYLKLGDKIYIYYIEDNVCVCCFIVVGIYQINFFVYDDLFLIIDLYMVNCLNGWQKGQVSGMELEVNEYSWLELVKEEICVWVDMQVDVYGGIYYIQMVEEVNFQIFVWLDLLDMNVWVILFFMMGVVGFIMIFGLLIIILECINMIGVLKVLGVDNFVICKIFFSFFVFLIGRGMLWGNIIGVVLCFI